ncbi:hypothetical protein [Streptomyces coffeae]|uniref:Uncharacterized protein n=1 Tax=Streptomyces coffeae TaxID=621382 RepID=A0ABS1NGK2_9ACTN|nr:hypothetical protein [Streptomyces coffeae]MBL1099052.1 hypothetical protein [Streptomyces coffeae]
MRTTRYRTARAGRGIAIDLTAGATLGTEPPSRGERISERMWLDTTPVREHPRDDRSGLRLVADEADRLRPGLALAADAIEARTAGRYVLVTVERVLFNEAHFQPEGLTAALLAWAEEEFGLPAHPGEVSFDEAAHRFVFTWPEPGGRP